MRRMRRRTFTRRVRHIAFGIAEKKYWDYAFNPKDNLVVANLNGTSTNKLAGSWANQGSLIACMPQGFAEGQRIGNQVIVKYIQLTILTQIAATANSGDQSVSADLAAFGGFCRYMVLYDRQAGVGSGASGSYPKATMTSQGGTWSVLPAAGGAQSMIADSVAFRDYNTLKRYKVLLDKQHNMVPLSNAVQATGGFVINTGMRVVQYYIPINKMFQWNATAVTTNMQASTASLNGKDLVFQVCPSSASGCCTMGVGVRVCYTDA